MGMKSKAPPDLSRMNRAVFEALDHDQLVELTCRLHTMATDLAGPERDGVFLAGLFQREESVATSSAVFAAGAAADFAQGDRVADFLLGDVGVERHLGPVEPHQQLGFAVLKAKQGLIEVIEAEGPLKMRSKRALRLALAWADGVAR